MFDTTADVLAVLNFSAVGATEADIVGELQFVFLTGAHLTNLSCLDHWWHLLLDVVLRAYALVTARPRLCWNLILTLHAQLVYSDRYLVDDSGEGSGDGSGGGGGILDSAGPGNRTRLREALIVYKRRLNSALLGLGDAITQEQAAVGHAFVDLEAWFWKCGWDLRSDYVSEVVVQGLSGDDDADDDYHPVVVQLDDRGREVGLVSWTNYCQIRDGKQLRTMRHVFCFFLLGIFHCFRIFYTQASRRKKNPIHAISAETILL